MGAVEMLRHFLELQREQWLDRDAIERLSGMRLRASLLRASGCRHYRELLDECGWDFPRLPITTKEEIRNDPGAFLPDGVRRESFTEIRTSGSSGIPLSICIDRGTQEYRIAKEYFVECSAGRSPFEVFAHFSSIPDPQHPILARTGLFPRLLLSPFVPDEENLSAIRSRKARMLRCYPSGLTAMARLNSKDPVRLKSVLSSGEVLDDAHRKTIEDSFSCPVLENYGMMEFKSIAFQCPEEGRFHVNEPALMVEIVGAGGKPKKSGRGEIVVTSFRSSPMPFIRYATGDVSGWGKECPCGRGTRTLGPIEGRKTDVFILPSGRQRPFGALYAALNRSNVRAFQMVQERPDLFVFRHIPLGKEMDGSERKEIEGRVRAACLHERITVEFEQVDSIPRIGRGKQPYVISKAGKSRQ